MPSRAADGADGNDASQAARVWELVRAQAAERRERASIADVCAAATSLDVSGAWVTVSDGISPGQTMCATDVVSESLAELQITLGEGPCHDAMTSGVPVLAADLADGSRTPVGGVR